MDLIAMKKFLLTLILLLGSTSAFAQCNGVFPNNTLCGNVTGSNAPPRAVPNSVLTGVPSGSFPQIQFNNSGVFAGETWGVFLARAVAAATNLSTLTTISTLGYAAAGDGGGALFKNVGSAAFLDTYINVTTTPPTLVGGSAYTNGTYLGVPLGGGTSFGCEGKVIVSGGAVTSVLTEVPCAGYKVGDVLTTPNTFIGGTGSGFTWTINAISTPQASFTDSAGNHWQYVVDAGNNANILQFGGKPDWGGTDGSSTNNDPMLRSMIAYLSIPSASGASLITGAKGIISHGAFMFCTSVIMSIPKGVWLDGQGIGGSTLKQCAASSDSINTFALCDTYAFTGQFGCRVSNMSIITDDTPAASGIVVFYSESAQQFPSLENLEIHAGLRGCLSYARGAGGASDFITHDIDCEMLSTATNNSVLMNSSGTQLIMDRWNLGCSPTVCTKNGINLALGALIFTNSNIEGIRTGVFMNNPSAANISTIANITVGSPCTEAIALTSTDVNNTALYQNIFSGGCALVTNGHSGGSSLPSGAIVLPRVFNP